MYTSDKRRGCNRNRGFTIIELLLAVLILLIATALIVQCTQIANREFTESTMISESQVLVADLATTVQDELTYATDMKGSKFTSYRYGAGCEFIVDDDGIIRISVNNGAAAYPVSNPGMYASDTAGGSRRVRANIDVEYDSGNAEYKVEISVNGQINGAAATVAETQFYVRPLNTL